MIIATKPIELNKSFSVKIPEGRVKDFDVLGVFNPYKIAIACTSQVNAFKPEIKPIHEVLGGYRFRIHFQERSYTQNTSYEFKLFNIDQYDVIEYSPTNSASNFSLLNSIAIPDKIKKASATTRKIIRWTISAVLTSLVWTSAYTLDEAYQKHTGGYFYKFLSEWSVKETSKKAGVIKSKLTNKEHPVFLSEEFKELQAEISEDGFGVDVKSLYHFEVDDLFVMKELHRLRSPNADGVSIKNETPKYSTKEDAEETCSKYKSRIPTRKELDSVMIKKISNVTDKIFKVKSEASYAEWVSDEAGDFYDIYMKENSPPPINAKTINGIKVVGDDNTYATFRCVFKTEDFE